VKAGQTVKAATHRCLRFQAFRVYTYDHGGRPTRRVGVVIVPLIGKG
jgi:hypothetical protein